MKLPDPATILALVASTLVAYGVASNAALLVCRLFGWTRAAVVISRVGGFVLAGLHVAQDIATHPNAAGARAALADLDELGAREPVAMVAAARLRAFAKLLGVTLVMALLVACVRPIDTAVAVVNGSRTAIVDAHDQLEASERDELARAVDASATREAAVTSTATIEARYAPWWLRYADLRLAWIATRATVEQAVMLDATNMSPDTLTVLAAVAQLGQAWGSFASAIKSQIKAGAK